MKRNPIISLASANIVIILFLLAGGLVGNVAADYKLTLADNGVRVQITGDLLQAVPFPPVVNRSFTFGSIPQFAVHIAGTNATSLSDELNSALHVKSSSASASEVTLDASSNGTIYHYSLAFLVRGITSSHGDVETVDLSWRSFALTNDVKAGNYTLNLVLPTYLGQRISQVAKLPPSTGPPLPHTRRWYLNGQLIDNEQVVSKTANVEMFNFSSLAEPLEQWTTTPDFQSPAVRYEASAGFNLTYHDQVTEIDQIANFISNAVHKVKAEVDVPWDSSVAGDTLNVRSFSWSTLVMTLSIVTPVGVVIATVFFERRVGRQSSQDPRTRKHRR